MTSRRQNLRNWAKRQSRKRWAVRIFRSITAAYMWLVYTTARKTFDIHPETKKLMDKGTPLLIGNWHSRLFLFAPFWSDKGHIPLSVISSPHADGLIVGGAAEILGLEPLRGTRGGKGGAYAMRAGLKALKQGRCLMLNPDGPSGPRQVLGEGTAALAQMSSAHFVAVAYSGRSGRFLTKSWDYRFAVPLFSHLKFQISSPSCFNNESDRETVRVQIETLMNEQMWALDEACGHPKISPERVEEKTSAKPVA